MNIKRIGVLTSGGDAPGMNAAIRAVTRAALAQGWQVCGIRNGFQGLLDSAFETFTARSVGGIIQQGGTILGSARCEEFRRPDGQQKAVANLRQADIDAVVVIGGNGSQTGSHALHRHGVPVVGVASTIDNDLPGTDITIGVDTALNIALEAIDRLKTTASSHQRAFLVEVMGRQCGYLALMAGIAGGAECVIIPEMELSPDEVATIIRQAYEKGKKHALVVVAEGAQSNAEALAQNFKARRQDLGFSLRVTTLGHVQRGGLPTAYDRLLASRLGAGAVQALAAGQFGMLIGMTRSELSQTPLESIVGMIKSIDPQLFELARVLDQ